MAILALVESGTSLDIAFFSATSQVIEVSGFAVDSRLNFSGFVVRRIACPEQLSECSAGARLAP